MSRSRLERLTMAASGKGSSVSRSKKWTFVGRGGKRKMSYIELSPEDPEEVLLPNYERAGDGGQSIFGRIRRAASKVSRRPKEKVILHHEEKAFIRSLGEVGAWDWEALNVSPPLVGPDRAQSYGQIAKRKRPEKKGDCTLVPVGRKTLVVDLCETLVYISRTPCDCDYEIAFKVLDDQEAGDPTVREMPFYVSLRPGLTDFLEKASALYELVVWTAAGKPLADAVLDRLDPDGKYFSHRLYREACTRFEGLYVKDVRRLGRPMHSVVVLDNSVYSFGLSLDNGVPISPWTGDKEAKEPGLHMAFRVLKKVARVQDVRGPLVADFNLHETIHGVMK